MTQRKNSHTMKKTIILAVLSSIVSLSSFGQAAGNSVYNESAQNYYMAPSNSYANAAVFTDSTIELGIDALMNVDANSYVVILGSSQVGETIDSCYNALNIRINNFVNQLTVIGIKKEDIYVDFVSQVPVFEYTPGQVKSAAASFGGADKAQVAKMLHILLNINKKIKHDDEYDAIAVGVTYLAHAK